MKFTIILLAIFSGLIFGVSKLPKEPQIATGKPVQAKEAVEWYMVVSEITKVFGPEGKQVVKRALDIGYCESSWREEAKNWNVNNTWDHSVFQINDVNKPTEEEKTDYKANIRKAYQIYLHNGKSFGAWVCDRRI